LNLLGGNRAIRCSFPAEIAVKATCYYRYRSQVIAALCVKLSSTSSENSLLHSDPIEPLNQQQE
jgi:hypothetical protein